MFAQVNVTVVAELSVTCKSEGAIGALVVGMLTETGFDQSESGAENDDPITL